MIAFVLAASMIVGRVPSALVGPSGVAWLSEEPAPVACELVSPEQWACRDVAASAKGVVVVIGSGGVAYQVVDSGELMAATIKQWGRLVLVDAGGVPPDTAGDLHCTAWTPERARFRAAVVRLTAIRDSTIECVRVSENAFWVAGDQFDQDAVVRLEGAAVAGSGLTRRSETRAANRVHCDSQTKRRSLRRERRLVVTAVYDRRNCGSGFTPRRVGA